MSMDETKTQRHYATLDTIGKIALLLIMAFLIVSTSETWPLVLLIGLPFFSSRPRKMKETNEDA